MAFSNPPNEDARLEALYACAILDTPPEPATDDLAGLAAQVCDTPMALLSLVDGQRVWFKAHRGVDLTEVPREGSFCGRAVAEGRLLVVADAAADPAFAGCPLVTSGERARFYAGVPIVVAGGHAVGVLSALDTVPRLLDEQQKEALQALGRQAAIVLEGRRAGRHPSAPPREDRARSRAQEMLAEGRFERVFRSLPGLAWISTLSDGRYVEANDAFLAAAGCRRDEVVGRTLQELNLLADPLERAQIRQRLRDQSAIHGLPVRLRSRAGEVRAGHLSAAVISFGAERCVLALIDDAAERHQEEQARRRDDTRVQRAQKLESLGLLAGAVGHDYNNLLMGILGNAGLALTQLPAGAAARQYVAEIEGAALRAAELTQQMLTYAGEGEIALETVNLSRLVEEVGDLLQSALSRQTVLRRSLAANLPAVDADPAQIRQVLVHLVTNAGEAVAGRSGAVRVSTGALSADRAYLAHVYADGELPEGTYVYLEVSDNGPGMDSQTQGRIFDPFFTTKGSGRGFGLAASLGITRRHRGGLLVESEPGRGTTIRVLFPAVARPVPAPVAAEPAPPSHADAAVSPEAWRGSGTALVVDDEQVVREVTRLMLELIGFTVLTACDGVEGVEIFRQRADEIDVVLLDMSMPGMAGDRVFDEILSIRPGARVILSTGYTEREAAKQFAGKGLAGFLQKPYQLQALAVKLREVLRDDPT